MQYQLMPKKLKTRDSDPTNKEFFFEKMFFQFENTVTMAAITKSTWKILSTSKPPESRITYSWVHIWGEGAKYILDEFFLCWIGTIFKR